MKITNRTGLPEAIVNAVTNDTYSRGDADISVTALLSPPRQCALKEKHADEIEEDVSERIWSLLGQAIHTILERANENDIAERRLTIEVEGWKVSGAMDLVHNGDTLSDYKTVTAYKFKDGKAPIEYEQQLNCYAEMLRQHGEPVKKLQIVGILRDWSKLEAKRDESYPQTQVIVVPVPVWPSEITQKFMSARVLLHQAARKELPLCSAEDRWAKPDIYAVLKQGGKRAVRVYENEDEAVAHAKQGTALYVQMRPGQNTRCENYCSVCRFCTQFKSLDSIARSEWMESKPLAVGQSK